MLDRVGRLQLPAEYVEALELERRVRLALRPDRINVFPDRRSRVIRRRLDRRCRRGGPTLIDSVRRPEPTPDPDRGWRRD